MALDAERRVGIGGLNLGADPTQLGQGALTLADGVRYLELGAAHSRGGRVRAGFEFPTEQYDTTGYQQTVEHFKASGRVRGFAPFYDQRIWPTTSDNITAGYPQRLYYIHKANGTLYMNDDYADSGTGIITGNGTFTDPDTRAKFVVYGDRVYVIDEKTAPRVMRRLPKANQTYLTRIKYGVVPMGIKWPTAGNSNPGDTVQKPVVTSTAFVAPFLPAGVFRFRIALENRFGVVSGPSVFFYQNHGGITISAFTVKWDTIVSTFPPEITVQDPLEAPGISSGYVRLYVQFTQASTASTEASAYRFVNRARASAGATGIVYTLPVHDDLANALGMRENTGAPPALTDLIIVNNVAYGAAGSDVVYREQTEIGTGTKAITPIPDTNPFDRTRFAVKRTNLTTIQPTSVNRSFLFWSDPGEPEYMENWVRLGDGSEIIVGLAALGKTCVILTNQGLYTFNAVDGELHTGFARVGCISRDSIVATERGVRFVATDGVPRLFNGATIEETADELLPIFDRDDYVGEYQRFDKSNAQEIIGTSGDRKVFMLFPVGGGGQSYKPGVVTDQGSQKYLAIGDNSTGATRWSLDRSPSYDTVYWLGREARLLAIDGQGYFYFLEEGAVDQQPDVITTTTINIPPLGTISIRIRTPQPSKAPKYAVATRRFSANGLMAQFYCVALDLNTQGETLQVECLVDDVPELKKEYTATTVGRDEVKLLLPSYFKGRFLDVKIQGTPSKRVALYGLTVESARRGEFS